MPTELYEKLWEGKLTKYRFSLEVGSLKQYVFNNLSVIRNHFVKRVKLTVEKFLHTDGYGMEDYTYEQRLNALHRLTKKGLERINSEFIITLPIFHAFSINREVDKLEKNINLQCCLFSHKVKKNKFLDVNGKRIQDILWSSDVARIITTICNMLVS